MLVAAQYAQEVELYAVEDAYRVEETKLELILFRARRLLHVAPLQVERRHGLVGLFDVVVDELEEEAAIENGEGVVEEEAEPRVDETRVLLEETQRVEAHVHLRTTAHRLTHARYLRGLEADELAHHQLEHALDVADETRAQLSRAVGLQRLIRVREQVVLVGLIVALVGETIGARVEIDEQALVGELEKEPAILDDDVFERHLVVGALARECAYPLGKQLFVEQFWRRSSHPRRCCCWTRRRRRRCGCCRRRRWCWVVARRATIKIGQIACVLDVLHEQTVAFVRVVLMRQKACHFLHQSTCDLKAKAR